MITAAQSGPASGRTFEEGDEDTEYLAAVKPPNTLLRLRMLADSAVTAEEHLHNVQHIVCFISNTSSSTAALISGVGSSSGAGGAIAPYAAAFIGAMQQAPVAVVESIGTTSNGSTASPLADVYCSTALKLLAVNVTGEVSTEQAFEFVSLLLPHDAGAMSISVFGTFSIASCSSSAAREGDIYTLKSSTAAAADYSGSAKGSGNIGSLSAAQQLLLPLLAAGRCMEEGNVVSDLAAAWIAAAEMRQLPAVATLVVTRAAVTLQAARALQQDAAVRSYFTALLPSATAADAATAAVATSPLPSTEALRRTVGSDSFVMKTSNLYC